jgi:hypothetical protein
VPKKPKAKQEKARTEIPAGAVIYGYATAEEVDGVRQVHIHGRGGRFTSSTWRWLALAEPAGLKGN